MADPDFNYGGSIDMLLGAEIFWELLCVGQIKNDNIVYQKSKLGWIATGSVHQGNSLSVSNCYFLTSSNQTLQNQFERFWKIEETNTLKNLTGDESECEQNFVNNYTREKDGRFVVTLPTRNNAEKIGILKQPPLNDFII